MKDKEVYLDYLHHDTQTNTNGIFYIDKPAKQIIKDMKTLEILKRYFNDYHNRTRLFNTFEGKDEYEILEEWLNEG